MPLVLVSEAEAAAWTGRPLATLRRWRHEGRITRHGEGRGRVRFNLFELPARHEDGTPGPAPARRT
jgi:predicted site-specific integrase-resolvase